MSTALRVLMVTGAYPTQQKPHSCTFIKSQVDSLLVEGLDVEVIHPKPGPVPIRYIEALVRVFFKTLTGRFDIVHGHYGLWCLIARLQWTTPVVASFLGADLLGEPTAVGGFSRKGAFVVAVSRWLCNYVDAVIVKSEEMKKITAHDNPFIVPNGVDFTLFHSIPRAESRAKLGWKQNCNYILFGNDPERPEKNFKLACAAIEQLHANGVSAELVVANGLPQTQVVLYINASNALLLPSLHEGSPNIVKEAMACNVPVIATDVGDVSQVIGHTEACAVCPANADALATALAQALRHTDPTTGRADIAHLERSIVAQQVIGVYAYARRRKAKTT